MMCKAGKRILIVEDTDSIAVLLAATLRQDGLIVDIAKTSQAAMSKFVTSLESTIPYDLLLVDLNLPDGDGADLLSQMASFDVCPPSIVVSADGSGAARSRAKAAGADDYVEKPFNLSLLKDKIEQKVSKLGKQRYGRKALAFADAQRSLVNNYYGYLAELALDLENKINFAVFSNAN